MRRDSGDPAASASEPCAERPRHVLLVEEALSVAESERFDIIVSDIGLPRIDGYELVARLRGLPHLREVPALALKGYAARRDAEAALAAGFDAHVPKPVDPADLAGRVNKLTQNSRQ